MGTVVSRKSSKVECSSPTSETLDSTIDKTESEFSQTSRKLWWSPKKSVVQIYDEGVKHRVARPKINSLTNVDYQSQIRPIEMYNERLEWNVSPRIDSFSNVNWNPSTSRVFIRNEKLKWNGQSRVNSLDNVDYKPTGGYFSPVYHQKLNLTHVQPKINTGFID